MIIFTCFAESVRFIVNTFPQLWHVPVATFSPDGDDLSPVELDPVHLSDEDGRHGLVERSAVHVDGGAHGEHEPRHSLVDAQVLLQAAERDGQGAGTVVKREEGFCLKQLNLTGSFNLVFILEKIHFIQFITWRHIRFHEFDFTEETKTSTHWNSPRGHGETTSVVTQQLFCLRYSDY